MPSKLRKLIGTREFYAMVLAVVLPIIVQNAISNFVNLLDNLMVGHTGTDQMSGVAIANQLIYVFNLAIFGAVSGAGIFTAQFHGAQNLNGIRESYRYKLYSCLILVVIAVALFLTNGERLVALYLTDTSDPARVQRTLAYAMDYLKIMLLGLLPFALSQCYASNLRETGETALPMYAGIIAVTVNLFFNYLLIFGKLGFPCLGVQGAAYATIISRYVEAGIIIIYTHRHPKKYPFSKGLYSSLAIPGHLVRDITRKGLPLLVNELLWATGMATLTQIYSLRGLDVVAATNISTTVYNLFSVVFLSMGSATAIIVGKTLGAKEPKAAKEQAWQLIAFSFAFSLVIGIVMVIASPFIPLLYNTSTAVHKLATSLILVSACLMPSNAIANCCYFTLRSGGKTGITFIFDSGFIWCVSITLAYALAHFTQMSIVPLFLCVQALEILKDVIGLYLVQKGVWINNIVSN